MTYEEAKKQKQILDEKTSRFGEVLDSFPKGVLGLVEESARNSMEYIEAKNNFNKASKELQSFNTWFLKNFKKEYLAERRNKYIKK